MKADQSATPSHKIAVDWRAAHRPPTEGFVLHLTGVLRIRDSALKHSCTREEISHAFDGAFAEYVLDDGIDPPKLLFIGPDSAGNFLELIGCDLDGGDTVIWHAMVCRSQYLELLPEQGDGP